MAHEAVRQGDRASPQEEGLRCRVRLADGRVFSGELPATRHRALQLGMLHAQSDGLVELSAGTRPPDGRLEISRRKRAKIPSRRRHTNPRVARRAAATRTADRQRRGHSQALRRRAARGSCSSALHREPNHAGARTR